MAIYFCESGHVVESRAMAFRRICPMAGCLCRCSTIKTERPNDSLMDYDDPTQDYYIVRDGGANRVLVMHDSDDRLPVAVVEGNALAVVEWFRGHVRVGEERIMLFGDSDS